MRRIYIPFKNSFGWICIKKSQETFYASVDLYLVSINVRIHFLYQQIAFMKLKIDICILKMKVTGIVDNIAIFDLNTAVDGISSIFFRSQRTGILERSFAASTIKIKSLTADSLF